MKKFAIALMFCSVAAFADSVTYSTTGYFNGSTGTTSVTSGGSTLSFTGISSTTVGPLPSGISLGMINASSTTTNPNFDTFAGDTFTLVITQSSPSSGTGSSNTDVNGTVSATSSGIQLNFSPATVLIGGDLYTFSGAGYTVVAPNSNSGGTSIQATVVSTPEPASLALLGSSLLGLGLLARRR